MPRLDRSTCDALIADAARPLLAAARGLADAEGPTPAEVARLRAIGPIELVPAALELIAARRRAARKLENAERLLCDREGVEQASGTAVARHKARRFAAAGVAEVVDVCCGIGGDAIELVRAGLPVCAVDLDPGRARMVEHNARCSASVSDAAELDTPPAEVAVHVDPARRIEGTVRRRTWRLDDLQPTPSVVERLLAGRAGALKLGPGTPLGEIPLAEEREIEIVGGAEGLLQCVVWTGALARAPGERTATRLADGASFTGSPAGPVDVSDAVGRFVLVPDPALERAGLVTARLGAAPASEVAEGLGLLTAEEPFEDPWFECRRVLATMPWRETKLRAWLRDHDAGEVVVRTRGGAVATERAARMLRGEGRERYTIFGLRLGRRVVAVVTPGR